MREEAVQPHTFDSYCRRRISFILPTKNRAQYLASALERCRTLKGPTDELIVIDGASTDTTKEVVEAYRDIVDIFVSEPDLGGPHAQNKAYLLASGKYVKQLGDDDIYYPDATEQAIRALEDHPEIDLLICGGTKEQNGKKWNSCVPAGVNYGKSTEDIFRYECASGVGHFVRRSSLAKFGILFPTRPNCDAAYVLEFIKKGGIVRFCRINSYHHILHDGSVTLRNKSKNFYDTRQLVREYCSLPFYIRWRMRGAYMRIYKKIRKGFYPFFRFINQEDMIRPKKRPVAWDGGFS